MTAGRLWLTEATGSPSASLAFVNQQSLRLLLGDAAVELGCHWVSVEVKIGRVHRPTEFVGGDLEASHWSLSARPLRIASSAVLSSSQPWKSRCLPLAAVSVPRITEPSIAASRITWRYVGDFMPASLAHSAVRRIRLAGV